MLTNRHERLALCLLFIFTFALTAAAPVPALASESPDSVIVSGDVLTATHDQYFTASPVWSSGPVNDTRGIAVGDVNGDGYLDLVCGNEGTPSALYLGVRGMLSTTNAWQSSLAVVTTSVALGDIDGDGDLDLVCGNADAVNTMYRNDDGVLTEDPVWTSTQANNTQSVLLADITGDGVPDLVCGNYAQQNVFYPGSGGTFTTTPVWSSGGAFKTQGLAVGDLNGDGLLDLFCGNSDQPNFIYLGLGATLDSSPGWVSQPALDTRDVEIADFNGDGWLDLVTANGVTDQDVPQPNHIYFGDSAVPGGYPTSPDWSTPPWFSSGVAAGDVDGDGTLDLAFSTGGRVRSDQNLWKGSPDSVWLNHGTGFGTAPHWSGLPWDIAQGAALADMDDDGALDFVVAAHASNKIFENISVPFSGAPDWQDALVDSWSTALGDVDEDGYLDVAICTMTGVSLFLSPGGVTSTTPDWQANASIPRFPAYIALGDVTGDGHIDLVLTHFNANGPIVYPGDGAALSLNPWYLGAGTVQPSGCAIGDLNGDGIDDIAMGGLGLPNRVYLGGNPPSATPWWSSVESNFTDGVTLGDVDGDGDLDLVCANADRPPNTLYLNHGSSLSSVPDWRSRPEDRGRNAAFGDIDGDGDLDLVFANFNDEFTMYRNDGGVLTTDPVWSSSNFYNAVNLALVDLDLDGDLDLAATGFEYLSSGNHSVVIFNEGGTLNLSPDLVFQGATISIASGDIDADGDFDLAFATQTTTPDFVAEGGYALPAHQIDAPPHRLPYSDGSARRVRVSEVADNIMTVDFTAYDFDDDNMRIVADYQYAGEPVWHPAVTTTGTGDLGVFAASRSGTDHAFVWYTETLAFDPRDVVLRLRAQSIPSRISVIQRSPAYFKDLGRFVPKRPQIAVSADTLRFPTMTLGDTTSLDIMIRNTGNRDLTISDIVVPSPEMTLGSPIPLSVAAGDTAQAPLVLAPRQQTNASGELVLLNNDPTNAQRILYVKTDIRPLAVQTELLTQTSEIPLGEAVTVQVIPEDRVHVESGFLYHRQANQGAAFLDSIALSPSIGGFIAVVPGEAVTEHGLDYYARVVNGTVEATSPPGAPAAFFTQAVAAPASISSQALPTFGDGFVDSLDVDVLVGLPEGARFDRGTLHFRAGGETAYNQVPVQPGTPPTATIPAQALGARGVQYYVELTTQTGVVLTDPSSQPDTNPLTLRVTSSGVSDTKSRAGLRYYMVSFPVDTGLRSFAGVITGNFGTTNPVEVRMWGFDDGVARYEELTGSDDTPDPGQSYWLIRDRAFAGLKTGSGISTPLDSAFVTTLPVGYSMVASPFPFTVAWEDMLIGTESAPDAVLSMRVENPLKYTPGQNPAYETSIVFEPFAGYWVNNISGAALELRIPPQEADSVAATVAVESNGGWQVGLRVATDRTRDEFNYVGVSPEASDKRDPRDRMDLPGTPGPALSLYIAHMDWGKGTGPYAVDMRNPGALLLEDGGHAWHVDVAKDYAGEGVLELVTIEAIGVETVPRPLKVILVDRHLNREIDLRVQGEFQFSLARRDFITEDSESRFLLLVGSDTFVSAAITGAPSQTALNPNYPNPFNPTTVIRYDLAQGAHVKLAVYDVGGRLVRTLVDEAREVGGHEVVWDGVNNRGEIVASGIYFYRMTAGNFTQARKMVLLK